jgi:hypothetical protein
MKRIVQTIGKTKFNGKNAGLLIVRYQVDIFLVVKKDPIYAVIATKIVDNRNASNLDICFSILDG